MPETPCHQCVLQPKPPYSLPKLAPNASTFTRIRRCLNTLTVMNPKHHKCKYFFRNTSTMSAEQKRHVKCPHSYIIHPFSTLSLIVNMLFFVSWTVSIIMISLDEHPGWWEEFELFILHPIQYAVIICIFFLGYVDEETKEFVYDHKKIVLSYLKGYFLFDFLAVSIELSDHYLHLEILGEEALVYIKVINIIFYGCRKEMIISSFRNVLNVFKVSKLFMFIAIHGFITYIYLHVFACVVFTIPKQLYIEEDPGRNSWFTQANFEKDSNLLNIYVYLDAMMLTLTYFFGTHTGRYKITLLGEQMSLTFVSIFGRLYTLYLIADTLKYFGLTGISESKFENYLSQLEYYMISQNIPQDTRRRLMKYYEYKLQRHYFNKNEIMDMLSEHLKREIFLFSAKKIVEKMTVLKRLPRDYLMDMVSNMKLITYATNDTIRAMDSPADFAYFVSSGTVSVVNKDGLELTHLQDGSEFGIITLVTGKTEQYNYIAVEPTEVFCLEKEEFYEMLSSYPEIKQQYMVVARNKISFYEHIEGKILKGGTDVLSLLERRKLLELPVRRHARVE